LLFTFFGSTNKNETIRNVRCSIAAGCGQGALDHEAAGGGQGALDHEAAGCGQRALDQEAAGDGKRNTQWGIGFYTNRGIG